MHFSSATALLAISSLGVTYAAPVANPQEDDLVRRRAAYSVVNVDGDSSSSTPATPEVDTVIETVQSTVTAPGAAPQPVTVTVTATPSSGRPSSSVAASSIPYFYDRQAPALQTNVPQSTQSPFASFVRRGLTAAGDPAAFARSWTSSAVVPPASSISLPAAAPSLAARQFEYSSAPASWQAPVLAPSLVPREFGGPSSSLNVPVPAVQTSPIVARGFGNAFSSGVPQRPSATLAARGFGDWSPAVPAISSASPSMPFQAPSLVARAWGTPVVPNLSTPVAATPLVARGFGDASSAPLPTWAAASGANAPGSPTPIVPRAFGGEYSSSIPLPASATPVLY
ncbi:hypothetical protein NUU61_004842 [Penicillium alfredii]|uniref:Uncharacterized protein n=1 Tax=Penicillium alfredii TaxID=1506179 RepID=A0A9W9F8H5_9EURO|nr:uncharacterized protein NUU61_004842 [Penicillium alfredii]KAJ5095486.1 hypothetical protein NUU61_004842 [Penicillium alfredii]